MLSARLRFTLSDCPVLRGIIQPWCSLSPAETPSTANSLCLTWVFIAGLLLSVQWPRRTPGSLMDT